MWLKIGVTLLAFGLASLPSPRAEAETVLRFSWFGPAVSDFNKDGVFAWGKQVEEATKGNVKINFLAASAGPPPAHFDLIKDGVVDAGYYLPGITKGRFILHQAAEFPFLGDTAAQTSVAYWRTYKRFFEKANEHAGVQVLTVLTHGPGMIHNSKRPIASAEDMSGLKFRVPGETIGTISKTLGAVPMFANVGQVPELLSKGVADGVFFPFNAIGDFKLAKVLPYTTLVPGGIYCVTFHLAVNPAKWNALSEADRQAIMSVSGEPGGRFIAKAWDAGDARGRAYAKEGGVQFTEMGPAFKAQIEKAFEPMKNEWLKLAKEKGVDGDAALKYMDEELKKLAGT